MPPRRVCVSLLLALSVAACHAHAKPKPTPEPHQVTVASWTYIGQPPLSLDPTQAGSQAAQTVAALLNRGLVRMDGQMHVVPSVADSWQIENHGLKYVFHLQQGLRFSNGFPLTAQDVVGSLRRSVTQYGGTRILAGYLPELKYPNGVPGIFAVGTNAVEILLRRPSPSLLAKLTLPAADIVDMAVVHKYGSLWTPHTQGLGPFRILNWTPGATSMTLVPNFYYYPRPPRLHRLTIAFSSQAAALKRFRSGTTQVVSGWQGPRPHISPELGAVRRQPSFDLDYVVANTKKKPLNSEPFRRSLALSIDRKRLVRRTLPGQAAPTGSPVPTTLISTPFQQVFDPKVALKELQASGHPFGHAVPVLHLLCLKTDEEIRRAQLLSEMWLRVLAIHVVVDCVPPGEYVTSIRSRHFQLAVVRWGGEYPDASDYLDNQLETGASGNVSGWSDKFFDRLLAGVAGDGVDSPIRIQQMRAAAQLAAIQAPWIPLDNPFHLVLISRGMRELKVTPMGISGWRRVLPQASDN